MVFKKVLIIFNWLLSTPPFSFVPKKGPVVIRSLLQRRERPKVIIRNLHLLIAMSDQITSPDNLWYNWLLDSNHLKIYKFTIIVYQSCLQNLKLMFGFLLNGMCVIFYICNVGMIKNLGPILILPFFSSSSDFR